jgi:NADPH:quinone reductase
MVDPPARDYPIEKAAQFVNLVTSCDLLDASRVQPGQWLALTAGNSTTATMVLQFAALRNVKVISMIRRAQNQIDLEAWGASEVIELASLA